MESTVIVLFYGIVYAFVMENQNKVHERKVSLFSDVNIIDIVNDARSINHVKLERNKNCQQSFNYDTCSTRWKRCQTIWMNKPNNIHYLRLLYSRLNAEF